MCTVNIAHGENESKIANLECEHTHTQNKEQTNKQNAEP